MSVDLLLYIVALVMFLMAAFGVPGRVAWGWLGAAAITITLIF